MPMLIFRLTLNLEVLLRTLLGPVVVFTWSQREYMIILNQGFLEDSTSVMHQLHQAFGYPQTFQSLMHLKEEEHGFNISLNNAMGTIQFQKIVFDLTTSGIQCSALIKIMLGMKKGWHSRKILILFLMPLILMTPFLPRETEPPLPIPLTFLTS